MIFSNDYLVKFGTYLFVSRLRVIQYRLNDHIFFYLHDRHIQIDYLCSYNVRSSGRLPLAPTNRPTPKNSEIVLIVGLARTEYKESCLQD